jgi:hypothetical protein
VGEKLRSGVLLLSAVFNTIECCAQYNRTVVTVPVCLKEYQQLLLFLLFASPVADSSLCQSSVGTFIEQIICIGGAPVHLEIILC